MPVVGACLHAMVRLVSTWLFVDLGSNIACKQAPTTNQRSARKRPGLQCRKAILPLLTQRATR